MLGHLLITDAGKGEGGGFDDGQLEGGGKRGQGAW